MLRRVWAWIMSRLAAHELDIACAHQPVGACQRCIDVHTADRFA